MHSNGLKRSAVAADPIYSAAFDGDLYQEAMAMIAQAFPGVVVLVVGQDSGRLAGNFLLHRGGPADLARTFLTEIGLPGGWLPSQWQQDIAHVYHDHDLGSAAVAGPVGRLLAGRETGADCLTGVILNRVGTRQLAVEVRYPRHREGELRGAIRDYLQAAVRHLTYALRIAGLRRRVVEMDHLMTSVLDLLPFAAFLIDADRHVFRMNARAGALLGEQSGLAMAPDGVLQITDPGADAGFVDLLGALRNSPKQRFGIMSVPTSPGHPSDILSVLRLNGASYVDLGPLGAVADVGPRFAVLCENFAIPLELSPDVLWRVFGLSSKEADLALSLLAGESIGDLAVRRKMSKETLRNQLAAVMRKTETARQQDLVALLTRLATVNAVA
ncbi:MAG: helix-turn-helix transcriptional regulator [Paracoccaceae bacterium]|nr:helix-turn-helix transcriptional regulator [Paracoccaceae bacterium]